MKNWMKVKATSPDDDHNPKLITQKPTFRRWMLNDYKKQSDSLKRIIVRRVTQRVSRLVQIIHAITQTSLLSIHLIHNVTVGCSQLPIFVMAMKESLPHYCDHGLFVMY